MKIEEAEKVMDTIRDLNTDVANAKKAVAQEIMNFLQRHLYARPDNPTATMKFKDWIKLSKMLKQYGAEL